MSAVEYVIVGCGDVGRRIAQQLILDGTAPASIIAFSRSAESQNLAIEQGLHSLLLDLDTAVTLPSELHHSKLIYLVPPQKHGTSDLRSQHFLAGLTKQKLVPRSVVLISTTGVYGNTDGAWVTEATPAKPQTERGQRRLEMEQQWRHWVAQNPPSQLRILRVPGIYANSRIPLARLKKASPVVVAEESGYSNRVHADDLAQVCLAALSYTGQELIFNVTDGTPGKISEYLQAAAEVAKLPPLPEVSLQEAKQVLTPAMLSYVSESRRISNEKMLRELDVALRYPDFRVGLRH